MWLSLRRDQPSPITTMWSFPKKKFNDHLLCDQIYIFKFFGNPFVGEPLCGYQLTVYKNFGDHLKKKLQNKKIYLKLHDFILKLNI